GADKHGVRDRVLDADRVELNDDCLRCLASGGGVGVPKKERLAKRWLVAGVADVLQERDDIACSRIKLVNVEGVRICPLGNALLCGKRRKRVEAVIRADRVGAADDVIRTDGSRAHCGASMDPGRMPAWATGRSL